MLDEKNFAVGWARRRAGRAASIVAMLLGLVAVSAAPASAQQPSDQAAAGYLKLEANVDAFLAVVDSAYSDPHVLVSGDSLRLPAGEHHVRVASNRASDATFFTQIEAGQTTRRSMRLALRPKRAAAYFRTSSYPVLRSGTNLFVMTDRGTTVYVDGERMGEGPQQLTVAEGSHVITARHPLAGTERTRVIVPVGDPPRAALVELYTKPKRSRSRWLALVPGGSQLDANQTLKGSLLLGGFLAAAGGAVWQHVAFVSADEEYNELLSDYYQADTEDEALRLGNQADAQHRLQQRRHWGRHVLAGVAISAYAYSFWDALRGAPGGYRRPKEPSLEPILSTREAGLRLLMRF